MNRYSNTGLLFVAFILAVGLVWIKGQEKINPRHLSGIQVTVENLPDNFLLPDPWIPPTTSLNILGPKNITELVRHDQTSFRIDISEFTIPKEDSPITIPLASEMFRTNLDPTDRTKISVVENSIWPRQAVIHVIPWNISNERPRNIGVESEDNQLNIPLYRLEKNIPIIVPIENLEEAKSLRVMWDPEEIKLTGRREALDRIEAVTTIPLDLAELPPDHIDKSISIRFDNIWDGGVRPVSENVQGVTVTLKVVKPRK